MFGVAGGFIFPRAPATHLPASGHSGRQLYLLEGVAHLCYNVSVFFENEELDMSVQCLLRAYLKKTLANALDVLVMTFRHQ